MTKISLTEVTKLETLPRIIKWGNRFYKKNGINDYKIMNKPNNFSDSDYLVNHIPFTRFGAPILEVMDVIKPDFAEDDFVSYEGSVYQVYHICECVDCYYRGFFEPTLINKDGDRKYISNLNDLALIRKLDIKEFPDVITLTDDDKDLIKSVLKYSMLSLVESMIKIEFSDCFKLYFLNKDGDTVTFKCKKEYMQSLPSNKEYKIKDLGIGE